MDLQHYLMIRKVLTTDRISGAAASYRQSSQAPPHVETRFHELIVKLLTFDGTCRTVKFQLLIRL